MPIDHIAGDNIPVDHPTLPSLRTIGYGEDQAAPANVFGRKVSQASTRSALATEITALGSAKATLHGMTSIAKVDGAIDFPETMKVIVEHGATWTKDTGGTVRIRGRRVDLPDGLFVGFLPGEVLFDLAEIDPEWWDSATCDQMACAAAARP